MSGNSRLLRGLMVAWLTLAAVTAFASAAVAAPSPATSPATALSFTPAKGLDSTPMYLVTPKPCPAAATNVVAEALGHGFPADGQPVVGNTSAGISHTAPFVLPLQDSFTGLAAVNGTALSGPYQITLRCTDSLGATTYATFTATITFSDAHHFTAPAIPKAVAAAIIASQNPNQDASPAPGAASSAAASSAPSAAASHAGAVPKSSASAAAGITSPGASPSAVGSLSTSEPATKASRSSSTSWQPWLVVIALLLIGFAVILRARELRQRRRRHENTVARAAESGSLTKSDSPTDFTTSDR